LLAIENLNFFQSKIAEKEQELREIGNTISEFISHTKGIYSKQLSNTDFLFLFSCPSCGKKMRIDKKVIARVKCSKCNYSFIVNTGAEINTGAEKKDCGQKSRKKKIAKIVMGVIVAAGIILCIIFSVERLYEAGKQEPAPKSRLKEFYDELVTSDRLEGLPEYEKFRQSMSDPKKAEALYGVLRDNEVFENLPTTFADFSRSLGLDFSGGASKQGAPPYTGHTYQGYTPPAVRPSQGK
jgi:transposase-like protein